MLPISPPHPLPPTYSLASWHLERPNPQKRTPEHTAKREFYNGDIQEKGTTICYLRLSLIYLLIWSYNVSSLTLSLFVPMSTYPYVDLSFFCLLLFLFIFRPMYTSTGGCVCGGLYRDTGVIQGRIPFDLWSVVIPKSASRNMWR